MRSERLAEALFIRRYLTICPVCKAEMWGYTDHDMECPHRVSEDWAKRKVRVKADDPED